MTIGICVGVGLLVGVASVAVMRLLGIEASSAVTGGATGAVAGAITPRLNRSRN